MEAFTAVKLVFIVIVFQTILDSVDTVDLVYDLPGSERKAAKKYVDLVYDLSSGETDLKSRRGIPMSMKLFKLLRNGGREKVRINNLKRFPSLFQVFLSCLQGFEVDYDSSSSEEFDTRSVDTRSIDRRSMNLKRKFFSLFNNKDNGRVRLINYRQFPMMYPDFQ